MIGTDIFKINRISLKESLASSILTGDEWEEYRCLQNDEQKKVYLATHFCAKEAIFKATQDQQYLSYEILHKENGSPYVKNHPEIEISISHDGEYVVSFVYIQEK